MDTIMDIIKTQAIQAGIKFIMSLLTPAGAFVKAAMMIIDLVKFFVQKAAQIMELVKAFTDGIKAIASGNIGAVAKAIENALGRAIPVVIGFLASLAGLGGLADKVVGVIQKIRQRIKNAIVKFWNFMKGKAKGLLGKFMGKSKKDNTHEPEKQKKIDAGFMYLKEEEKRVDDNHNNRLTLEQANKAAKKTKAKYPVFSSLRAESKDDKIIYRYTASPENIHETGTELESTENGQNKEGVKLKLYIIQPLFTLYANNPTEFRKQIKRQEEGINIMKVDKWIANREEFVKNGRKAGDLDKLREMIREDISEAFIKREGNKIKETFGKEEVERRAKEYAKTILTRNHAILHNPDQVAGGDAFLRDLYQRGEISDETSLNAHKLVGHLGTNSSIGSQWSKERAKNLYDEVIKQTKNMNTEEKNNTFMNVNLKIE